jgi:signal transduction histidine kinase
MNWLALGGIAAVAAASAVVLRRWPVPGLSLLLAGSIAMRGYGQQFRLAAILLPIVLTGLAVCYIAATRARWRSVTAAAVTIAVQVYVIEGGTFGFFQLTARPASPLAVSQTVTAVLAVFACWLAGHSIRQSHIHAETSRAQAELQAATAERLRIARELHDLIAHSIGVIAIQAGVGSRVIDTQPAEARNALTAIEATSRETLTGLRWMLGVLRSTSELGHDPVPGLAGLDQLAATSRNAGVRVELHWRGQRQPIPPDVDLSAYRIIQEAVTNVIRHAGADHCEVLIDQDNRELSIEITDNGRGGVIAGPGYGIVGMRERAGLHGGKLAAGPRPGGGFRVAARLPVPAAL